MKRPAISEISHYLVAPGVERAATPKSPWGFTPKKCNYATCVACRFAKQGSPRRHSGLKRNALQFSQLNSEAFFTGKRRSKDDEMGRKIDA